MQRLGEEFQRLNKKVKNIPNKPQLKIDFFSSNAIDFSGLKGVGKKFYISDLECEFHRNLPLKRFECEKITEERYNNVADKFQKIIKLPKDMIIEFLKEGPILKGFFEYVEELKKHNTKPFDIIHCTYFPYNNLLYSLYLGKLFNIPTIITPFIHQENPRYQQKDISHLLGQFSNIIVCTEYEKKTIVNQGISPDKFSILPMGIDWLKFQNPLAHLANEIYKVHSPCILFCGHKNYEKGALTLLKTIPRLLDEIESIYFIFIGPSTKAFNLELSKLKGEIKNLKLVNISPDNLNGYFDKKKIGLFQLADIYCMPSRSEAYGIAYLEAWATKTPVIASNFPAMREVVNFKDDKHQDGILVEFDNEGELKKTILFLINHPEKRELLGVNGFEKIKKNNSWDLIATKTLDIYRNLVRRNEEK